MQRGCALPPTRATGAHSGNPTPVASLPPLEAIAGWHQGSSHGGDHSAPPDAKDPFALPGAESAGPTLILKAWKNFGSSGHFPGCRRRPNPCGQIQNLEVNFGVGSGHGKGRGRAGSRVKHGPHPSYSIPKSRHPAEPDGSPWVRGAGREGASRAPRGVQLAEGQLPPTQPLLPTRRHWRGWGTFSTLLKSDKSHR